MRRGIAASSFGLQTCFHPLTTFPAKSGVRNVEMIVELLNVLNERYSKIRSIGPSLTTTQKHYLTDCLGQTDS